MFFSYVEMFALFTCFFKETNSPDWIQKPIGFRKQSSVNTFLFILLEKTYSANKFSNIFILISHPALYPKNVPI